MDNHHDILIEISSEDYHYLKKHLFDFSDFLSKYYGTKCWCEEQNVPYKKNNIIDMLTSPKMQLKLKVHGSCIIGITGNPNSQDLAIISKVWPKLGKHSHKTLLPVSDVYYTRGLTIQSLILENQKFKNNKGKI